MTTTPADIWALLMEHINQISVWLLSESRWLDSMYAILVSKIEVCVWSSEAIYMNVVWLNHAMKSYIRQFHINKRKHCNIAKYSHNVVTFCDRVHPKLPAAETEWGINIGKISAYICKLVRLRYSAIVNPHCNVWKNAPRNIIRGCMSTILYFVV